MRGRVIGRVIRYRGKRVKVVERATGFVDDPWSRYWVKAIEPVVGYKVGEEFTVSVRHIRNQIRRNV